MKKSLTLIFLLITIVSISQQSETVTRDGKIYKTIVIGTQNWMSENLNISTFRNGNPIPEVKTEDEWIKVGKVGKPIWCYCDNDRQTEGFMVNYIIGVL